VGNRVLHGYLTACAGVIHRPLHAVYYTEATHIFKLQEGIIIYINTYALAEQITHGQEDAAGQPYILYKRALGI